MSVDLHTAMSLEEINAIKLMTTEDQVSYMETWFRDNFMQAPHSREIVDGEAFDDLKEVDFDEADKIYDASDILHNRFENIASNESLDLLIETLNLETFDWIRRSF